MKFRAQPIEVEAIQFLGITQGKPRFEGERPEWLEAAIAAQPPYGDQGGGLQLRNGNADLYLVTRDVDMLVNPGDWIVLGPTGVLSAMRPAVFRATYARDSAERIMQGLSEAAAISRGEHVEGAVVHPGVDLSDEKPTW